MRCFVTLIFDSAVYLALSENACHIGGVKHEPVADVLDSAALPRLALDSR